MIKGLTHNEDGVVNDIAKYRGKISAGYSPGEGSNNTNHPVASGFFRMLTEITRTKRVGIEQKAHAVKEWVLNTNVQDALVKHNNGSETPRMLKIVSLYETVDEMWESSLAMYSQTDGLLCKSHGIGTVAKYLEFDSDENRKWVNRIVDGFQGCPYQDCPDFKAGKCKAIGLLKCFPIIDLNPNPYRFETRSVNTITGIESSLRRMWALLGAAHTVKEKEAGKSLKFEGMFGSEFMLVHRKVKSGGRDVFITDLKPTPNFTKLVMEPIKRGFLKKSANAYLPGADGEVNMLEQAGMVLIESVGDNADLDGAVPINIDEQRDIAINFPTNAESDVNESDIISTVDDGEKIDDNSKKDVSTVLLNEEESDSED